jgi:acetyl-CoA/propionyl-CoA carboxylase biotin carboxyl carrier protein
MNPTQMQSEAGERKLPFRSVLIANRGEIAVRIVGAARALGMRSIAIFSEADEGALWTRLADEAHLVGPAPARASYLDIKKIVAIAKASGAEAVHPGYGLLSENADFAREVREAGIAFIGPLPETIAIMGDKVTARAAARSAGLPILPGSDDPVSGVDEALALAADIGWPIAVKASFGGGGRGMRVAVSPEELAGALEQAGREAAAAFGRAEVFLERFLVRPRHVEVQVLGDCHGEVVHLGDRDCSVQRRHQKLIEEAPAPGLPDPLRQSIREAAVRLCKSVGYQGAGTVEFLVDVAEGTFFFLEMNTRLQVEHGVTELVTGIDLVERQIAIAAGEPVGLDQDRVEIRGHAIQARIAAEDPWEEFRPRAGLVDRLELPFGPWLRLDFGVTAGDPVQPHYDSMFGKIQAWGATREEARLRLGVALDDFSAGALVTTAPYLRSLLDRTSFALARHDTGMLEREWQPDPKMRPAARQAVATEARAPGPSQRLVHLGWGGRSIETMIYGVASTDVANGADSPSAGSRRGEVNRSTTDSRPEVAAPMDAVIVAVTARVDQAVTKGETLLILEAMKMEMNVVAPHDGVVTNIAARPGQTVKRGEILAAIASEQALP